MKNLSKNGSVTKPASSLNFLRTFVCSSSKLFRLVLVRIVSVRFLLGVLLCIRCLVGTRAVGRWSRGWVSMLLGVFFDLFHEFGAGHGFFVEGFEYVVAYEAFGHHGGVPHPVLCVETY